MQKILNTYRYLLFGKQIQLQMQRAEKAGRETAEHIYTRNLWDLESIHKKQIDTLANKKIAEMGYFFNPDDILTASINPDGTPRLLYLGKEQIGSMEINNLKAEVKFLRASKIWPIITSTLKSQANDIMFIKSKDYDDMRSGKMMIFNLSVQEGVLTTIEKMQSS